MEWVIYYNVHTIKWQKVIHNKPVKEYKTSIHNSKEEAEQAIIKYGKSLTKRPYPKEYYIPNYPQFTRGIEIRTDKIMQL